VGKGRETEREKRIEKNEKSKWRLFGNSFGGSSTSDDYLSYELGTCLEIGAERVKHRSTKRSEDDISRDV
jgi:hypothetical protein